MKCSDLIPGDYTVFATRGFEYGLARRRVRLRVGERRSLHLSLRREVATPGWVRSDTHVHTFTSARAYARQIVREAGSDVAGLLAALAGHDEPTAVQAADLWQKEGGDTADSRLRQGLTITPIAVQSAFRAFARARQAAGQR